MPMPKKFVIILIIPMIILTAALSSCNLNNASTSNNSEFNNNANSTEQQYISNKPTTKSDGSKFRIAYVDIDPYPDTGKSIYYIVEGLREAGWLSYDTPPFDPDNLDAREFIYWIIENSKSDYIEFIKDATYYLAIDGEDIVKESILEHANVKKDIDLIIALGTWPGKFLKNLNLSIPVVLGACIDPVGSDIVSTADYSGNTYFFAHTSGSAYSRQLEIYHKNIKFKNVGMVYNDEIVAAMPSYREAAEKNSFTITEVKVNRLDNSTVEGIEAYHDNLSKIYKRLIEEYKIDAYLLNTDLITNLDYASQLMQVFHDNKIPVLLQISDAYTERGAALLLVQPLEYQDIGRFLTDVIGQILNGAMPGDLNQSFVSNPFLTLNLDVAEKIGYTPSFDLLLSCEKVYSSR